MILKDWRESFKADFLDPEFQRGLLVLARQDDGGPQDIIASLRNIAWAQEEYEPHRAGEEDEPDNAPYLPDYRGSDNFTHFITVCEALEALGLDLVLVRRPEVAQEADAGGEQQNATRVMAEPQAIAA